MKTCISFLISCLLSLSVLAGSAQDDMISQAREYRQQGYKLQSVGNIEEALVYYQKAAQIYPGYKEVFNDIGVVYESLGNKKEALMMYKKALKIDPDYLPAHTNLALFYEAQGNIKKAADYWHERYRRGRGGGYWREKAKEKLLKLGTYPEVRREMLENDAFDLSKNVVYKREQRRLKNIEEAKLHFEMGRKFFKGGDYVNALKELNAAVSFSPGDKDLQMNASNMYAIVERAYAKQKIKHYIDDALASIDDDNYLSAKDKIKRALDLVSRFSR